MIKDQSIPIHDRLQRDTVLEPDVEKQRTVKIKRRAHVDSIVERLNSKSRPGAVKNDGRITVGLSLSKFWNRVIRKHRSDTLIWDCEPFMMMMLKDGTTIWIWNLQEPSQELEDRSDSSQRIRLVLLLMFMRVQLRYLDWRFQQNVPAACLITCL